jgi:hypothetical protein
VSNPNLLLLDGGGPTIIRLARLGGTMPWPAHQKPGPGAFINRSHPLALALTRCHIYQQSPEPLAITAGGRDHDLVWGSGPRQGLITNCGKRLSKGLVGWALDIPSQGSDTYHGYHTWGFQTVAVAHGDWDPEENGAKPRAPFTAAVFFESTFAQAGSTWPMVLMCQNFGGTRAGFEIALYSSTSENFPNFVSWTTGSQQSATYGKNPGGPVNDGRPHLLVGGVNQLGRGWLSLDGRPPVFSDSVVSSGNWNMRQKNMAHGHFTDASQAFARVSDTRVGGWMFWKRELRPEECALLWEELYSGLILAPVPRRPRFYQSFGGLSVSVSDDIPVTEMVDGFSMERGQVLLITEDGDYVTTELGERIILEDDDIRVGQIERITVTESVRALLNPVQAVVVENIPVIESARPYFSVLFVQVADTTLPEERLIAGSNFLAVDVADTIPVADEILITRDTLVVQVFEDILVEDTPDIGAGIGVVVFDTTTPQEDVYLSTTAPLLVKVQDLIAFQDVVEIPIWELLHRYYIVEKLTVDLIHTYTVNGVALKGEELHHMYAVINSTDDFLHTWRVLSSTGDASMNQITIRGRRPQIIVRRVTAR